VRARKSSELPATTTRNDEAQYALGNPSNGLLSSLEGGDELTGAAITAAAPMFFTAMSVGVPPV
jgi:hypothetical protein